MRTDIRSNRCPFTRVQIDQHDLINLHQRNNRPSNYNDNRHKIPNETHNQQVCMAVGLIRGP